MKSMNLLVCLTVLLINACSPTPVRIDGTQYELIEPEANNSSIGLILSGYSKCDAGYDCEVDEKMTKQRRIFDRCLEKGMKKTSPKSKFRKDLYGLLTTAKASANEAVEQIEDDATVNKLNLKSLVEKEVDYVAYLDVRSNEYGEKMGVEFPAASGGGQSGALLLPPVIPWAIGESWTESAYLYTAIYNTKTGTKSAEITAAINEEGFWMLPVITIIPLLPVGYSPNVEDTTCVAIGEAIGRFMNGDGNVLVKPKG